MRYTLLLFVFFLSNCSSEKNNLTVSSEFGFEKTKTGYYFDYKKVGYDGTGVFLTPGEDGKHRESDYNRVIQDLENCTYGSHGLYDWVDAQFYTPGTSDMGQAGCFTEEVREKAQSRFGYFEDHNGTYYHDKDGGGYNLRRISTKNGGFQINDLVTISSSGWILEHIPLYLLGDDEVYMNGIYLSGVTDIYGLKAYNLGGDFLSPIVTDGKSTWFYKTQFEGADPNTLHATSSGIAVDRSSCYILLPLNDIKKLPNCNPLKISKITEDYGNWMDTKVYTDGKNSYNAYGDLISN